MNGTEHYRKSEEQVRKAEQALAEGDVEASVTWSQIAQVHATLAAAAATALAGDADGMHVRDSIAWADAAGVQR